LQMPYGSAVWRMLARYASGSAHCASVGLKTGA